MSTPRRVTSADVARRVGVSTSAVSYALNGRPGVSEETRERIHAVAAEMGWRPNTAARALSGARAGVVGLVLNRPARSLGSEAFFGDLVAGLQAGLQPSHVALSLLVATTAEEERAIYRDWARDRRVDGVLLTNPRRDDDRVELLQGLGLPAVVLGNHPMPAGGVPSVWIDDSAVTTTLMEYLWALGHRRIARVAGERELEHSERRAVAMSAFMKQHHAPPSDTLTTDYSAAEGAHATRYLLSRMVPPSAIVYDSDVLAVAGLGVAQEMGLEVPARLSIASFDDSTMAQLVRPRLTTMSRDTVEFGERAARLLLRQLDSPTPVPSEPGPPVTLTVRDSTAPPPAAEPHYQM